ncbi:MAG TPA: hypothetical protein VMS38_31645, partial [Pseudorhodoferax sp.]|nr:hypothetical protein [Pseudorhodoferax sp.]
MKLHKLFKTLAASWLLFLVAIGAHAGPVVTVGAGERARLVFDLGAYQPLWRFDLTLVVPPFAAGAAFQTQLWEQTDALSGLRQDWGVQTVGGGGFAYRGQVGDSYFDVLTD